MVDNYGFEISLQNTTEAILIPSLEEVPAKPCSMQHSEVVVYSKSSETKDSHYTVDGNGQLHEMPQEVLPYNPNVFRLTIVIWRKCIHKRILVRIEGL